MGIMAYSRDARLMKIYCDGAQNKAGGGLSTENPWTEATNKVEYDAWASGWSDRNSGPFDQSVCGYPVAGALSPEVGELRDN